jgi:hypothetical protein
MRIAGLTIDQRTIFDLPDGHPVPLFANVTLQTAKFIGSYANIMEVLNPIATDVLEGVIEILKYYVGYFCCLILG